MIAPRPIKVYELDVDDPVCAGCGYNLRGLFDIAGARCPECGARLSFDRLIFPGGAGGAPGVKDAILTWAWIAVPVALLALGRIPFETLLPSRSTVRLLLLAIPLSLVLAAWLLAARSRHGLRPLVARLVWHALGVMAHVRRSGSRVAAALFGPAPLETLLRRPARAGIRSGGDRDTSDSTARATRAGPGRSSAGEAPERR